MFTEMLAALQKNTLPDDLALKGRLHIALIKKEAVLRLPPPFRVADPKINPRADHMIWAAVLLNDQELYDITTTILLTEVSMKHETVETSDTANTSIITATLQELLDIPTKKLLKETINNRIEKLTTFNMLD